jgi:hypothetical protein
MLSQSVPRWYLEQGNDSDSAGICVIRCQEQIVKSCSVTRLLHLVTVFGREISSLSGLPVPIGRCRRVGWKAKAVHQHGPKVVRRTDVPLLSGLAVQVHHKFQIPWGFLISPKPTRQMELHFGITLLGGFGELWL